MSRSLIETQTKQIQKEISKSKSVISNKIVLFKSVKAVQNFIIGSLT